MQNTLRRLIHHVCTSIYLDKLVWKESANKSRIFADEKYLGLVELDENGNIAIDEKGEPIMNKYPKFSQFKKQVLDVVRADLLRMAERNETDIIFEEFKPEDFIYPNGKSKGDPEYIVFRIKRTDVGILHLDDKMLILQNV